MQTCRANFRSFFTYSDVTAVTALPYHFAFFSEYSHIFDVVHESKVSFFVTFFCDGEPVADLLPGDSAAGCSPYAAGIRKLGDTYRQNDTIGRSEEHTSELQSH